MTPPFIRTVFLLLLMLLPGVSGCEGLSPDKHCLIHDGEERCFLLHIPEDLPVPAPLVLDLHALGYKTTSQRDQSGYRDQADEQGFIVAWPTGKFYSWNSGPGMAGYGPCCGQAQRNGVDDVGFMRAVVDRIVGSYPVDSRRIYATGLSNGGAMVQRLALEAPDIFAAVVSYSQYLNTEPGPLHLQSGETVSVLNVHGLLDSQSPYDDTPGTFPGARQNLKTWGTILGCNPVPLQTIGGPDESFMCETLTGCPDKIRATLCSLKNGFHRIYRGSAENPDDVDVTRLGVEFMLGSVKGP